MHSVSYIFSSLPPSLKTLFTWGIVHLLLGIFLWLKGQWGNGLALSGFAYLVIFDAMGIFTTFISTVLITYRSLGKSTIKNPFGIQRYEILFGFINILYLLFVALYILKEGLEHLLLETSEEHYDHNIVFPLYWVIFALGVTLISAINYRNHKGFCILWKKSSLIKGIISSTSYFNNNNGDDKEDDGLSLMIFNNLFTITVLICGISVIIVGKLMEKNQHLGWLDKVVSIIESMLMFCLACPIATSLGKILLQTTPDSISMYLEDYLREVKLDTNILSFNSVHFWQNSYGQLIGTICIQIKPDANEQTVLKHVYQKLSPLLINHNSGEMGELTIQIIK